MRVTTCPGVPNTRDAARERASLRSCSHLDRTGRPYIVLSLAPMGDRLDNINTAEAQLQAMQYT